MNRLTPFTNLPEVKDAVISDLEGTLIEHTAADDAESVAAVMSYFFNGLAECGETLGFGKPSKVSCSGSGISMVLFVQEEQIWTIYLEDNASLSTFEQKAAALRTNAPKRSGIENRRGLR